MRIYIYDTDNNNSDLPLPIPRWGVAKENFGWHYLSSATDDYYHYYMMYTLYTYTCILTLGGTTYTYIYIYWSNVDGTTCLRLLV